MASIGSFGTPREAPVEDLTFDYFGVEYRVHPDATDLELFEFMDVAASLDTIQAGGEDAAIGSVVAIRSALRNLVHPDDYAAVWSAAKANRQTIEDLTELAMALAAAVADRPTERPSDSSDGPQSTEPSSTDDSSSLDSPDSAVIRSIRRHEAAGRPDLALAVEKAQERLVPLPA